jgi:transcriptional regulator with XRE-family HTH domain
LSQPLATVSLYGFNCYVLLDEVIGMVISERIFPIMKKPRMTQKEFSKKTGILESTISDWKNNTPGADKIMDICNVLQVSPYELLADDETKKPDGMVVDMNTDLGVLIEVCGNLTKEQRSRCWDMLRGSQKNDGNPKL